MKRIYIQVIAAVLTVSLSGCALEANRLTETESTARQTAEESSEALQSSAQTAPTEETESPYKTGKLGDDYLLPDAGEHVYTDKELAQLTAEELRLARNEIYAKHGRKFKSDDLNRYFSSKTWYEPSVDPDHFDSGVLNQNEKDNLQAVQRIEEGRSVCTAPKIGVEDFPAIDGSTATLPIMQALYRMTTGGSAMEAEAAVRHSKTTGAWMSLFSEEKSWYGESDLVIAYEPGEEVRKAMEQSGQKVLMKPIGRDALVFLANKSNPVKSLTDKQIVDIYSGAILNWKDVGGNGGEIKAFQRPENSGSQNLMEKLVMKGVSMAEAPKDMISGEMGDLMEDVSAYDGAGESLGYSVYYYARNMYQKPELTFMKVNGIMPGSSTIRDGSYPYVNDFYAAVRADEPKDSKAYQLFEWLTSEDGQSLINGLGYVGVGEDSKELPAGLAEQNETFEGSIPLPEGYVILASGRGLYGEAGIAVFDSNMRLLQFISHMDSSDADPYLECSRDTVIPVMDTVTGQEGHYSIAKNQWTDRKQDDKWETLYRLQASFAKDHPELLQKYGVTEDDVATQYYFESSPPIIEIRQGNLQHFYDVNGRHLLDYDTEGKTEEELPFRYVAAVGANTAYICIRDSDTYDARYIIYQDGKPVKELYSNDKGDVGFIGQYFYTRWNGPYTYIYNYKDEACAKFLNGYYNID